ncbi:Zinc finger protein 16 [Chionoecetes opilio]|uniref:Zinc finger protein 16 n=1 Tax=Chionoecetes opilio TaxID=41210 RepID=A0A8J4YS52_CHIOP|nr:Zinc finger protein 16 [Chionoecetes opilio]
METEKTECLTCPSDAPVHKASNILDTREGPATLKNAEVDAVKEEQEPQAAVTTLPAEVEALGSNNHIHFQLFGGQVIHITSAPLEVTEGGDRMECVGDVRRDGHSCVVSGGMGPDRGTVTLLTSHGKTYILPQHLTSAEDGKYLLSDGVLNAAEILHSDTVLQEEEMLTISPPPPQSSLDCGSAVESHPDALAIATSEVFSEEYVSMPVHTQGPLVEQAKTFRFKTVDTESPQEISDKIFANSRLDSQRRLLLPDAGVITLNASEAGGSDEWMEKNSCFISKRMLNENRNAETLISDDSAHLAVPHCKVQEVKDCSDDIRQIQLDIASSSVHSKWVSLQNNVSNNFYAAPVSPRMSAEQDGFGRVKSADGGVSKTTEEESDEKSLQHVNSGPIQNGRSKLEMQDKTKLRRSSRIRKVKKILNEEGDLTEEVGSWRRSKGMTGEAPSTLWECGSCDAMFRTRVGRDRHMKEGHAFTCYVCGWEGHTKLKYEIHVSTVHCNQQARCLACRKDFPGYEAYKQHMQELHAGPDTTPTDSSATTASVGITVGVKREVESNIRLEEQVEKEDQCGIIMEEKHVLNNADFKDFHCEGDRSCPYCSKTFTRRSRFLRHLNYHLGNRTFTCKICAKCFVEKSGLDAHQLTHCPINKECSQCGKVFKTERTMTRHLRTHLNRTYTCDVCNKQFRHEESLRVHKSVHKEGGECEHCPPFRQISLIIATIFSIIKGIITAEDFLTTTAGDVLRPKRASMTSDRFEKLVFTKGNMQLLDAVLRRERREGEWSGNVCHVCDKDCKTPHYLQLHMTTKHEAAKFTCHQCNRSFKWKQSFRKHMAIHHEDACLKFKCDLCPRHFMTTSELRLHQVVHSSEKKHLCDICGKAFKHEYTRDKHTKTVHRDDREHMCPQCGTLFKAKAYLDQHLAHVHTTKDRVTCRYCGNNFKTEANLRSHIKVVHKPRNPKYTCRTCNKMFLAPKDLQRHSKVHTGIKEFGCPLCQRCFSRKDNMVAHLRTHTPPGHSPDQPLSLEAVTSDVVPQASHQVEETQEVPCILGLPSSNASNLPSASSPNIILSSVPTTTGNIVISEDNQTNRMALSGESSSQTTALVTPPTSSCVTTVMESPATTHNRVSITNLPVSSMADIPNMPPSSVGSIMFSTVPISSLNNVSVCPSTSAVASSGTLSHSLAWSTSNSLSGSNTSSSSGSLSAMNPSASSPSIHFSPNSPLAACATHPSHQAYTFHPQLVVSSPNQVSNISSLLTASPVPSTVLSLPPSHSTSAPVLVSQNSRTQMVCSTLQGEQVMLTTGPLTPISKVSMHDGSPPQYTQLAPLDASACSTPSTSVNVTFNPLSPSVSSATRNLNATLGVDVALPPHAPPHTPSVVWAVHPRWRWRKTRPIGDPHPASCSSGQSLRLVLPLIRTCCMPTPGNALRAGVSIASSPFTSSWQSCSSFARDLQALKQTHEPSVCGNVWHYPLEHLRQ